MKVAIYARACSQATLPYIQEVFDCLGDHDVQVYVFEDLIQSLGGRVKCKHQLESFECYSDVKGNIDVMLSLGGDGTMLDTVTLIRDSEIPVIGINLGRLGFLASIRKDNIGAAINRVIAHDYTIDQRELIQVDTAAMLFGESNFCLNDFTIHRRDNSAMMIIHAYLNDEFLNSYWADGLIVATPTGSTAYSLSCGGPIIVPHSNNFVITPVAPHNLNVRPMVISDSSKLKLEIEGRSSSYLISLDSRTEVIDSELTFNLKKTDFHINLIRLKEESYLSTLRSKMHWGLDSRN